MWENKKKACNKATSWTMLDVKNLTEQKRWVTTKQACTATTTTKTKFTVLILIKFWRQVVLLWFPSQDWPSTVKSSLKSKKKETFPSFLDNDLWFYRRRLNGTRFHGCRPQNRPNDVTNPFDFEKWQSTASRTSEVPRVQNILKLYNTNQDYTIVNNCLILKQQTFTVQFQW